MWFCHRSGQKPSGLMQRVRACWEPHNKKILWCITLMNQPSKTSWAIDPRHPQETREISSSDTDSSSSNDSVETGIEQNDPHVAPRAWDPDLTMYRNIKSKVVHVVAEGGASSFSCGIRITSDYEQIEASAFSSNFQNKRHKLI